MSKKYNNPYMEIDGIKQNLHDYIEKTKPKLEMF